MLRLLILKILHPTATIYIRYFPNKRNKVYYELWGPGIWYCKAANEIIIETNGQ